MQTNHLKIEFSLTPKEEQIFDFLLQILSHFNLQTQLRIAGGWVRDKLLGKESSDIDIAIDDMLGGEFCVKVKEYLLLTEGLTKKFRVSPRNVDKSRYLEKANITLFDVSVDFVNLSSCDPTKIFGTPEEDVLRRDLTINSLFYNINTSSVEDFTERGIDDLKAGIIVTPLPPKQTFTDDPICVLRAIRFGARLGFVLDEGLKKAATDSYIKSSLADKEKVCPERVCREVDLMICGKDPVMAMTYISDFQLFSTVFNLPPEVKQSFPEGYERLCVSYLDSAWRLLQSVEFSSFTDDMRRFYLYAALFLPIRNIVFQRKKRKKIINLHRAAVQFVSLTPLMSSEHLQTLEVWKKCRKTAGFLLREIKEFWRPALLLSLLINPDDYINSSENDLDLNQCTKVYKDVEKAILEMGLESVWELNYMMNGDAIKNMFLLESDGPFIHKWREKVMGWQLENPCGSVDELRKWMRLSLQHEQEQFDLFQ